MKIYDFLCCYGQTHSYVNTALVVKIFITRFRKMAFAEIRVANSKRDKIKHEIEFKQLEDK